MPASLEERGEYDPEDDEDLDAEEPSADAEGGTDVEPGLDAQLDPDADVPGGLDAGVSPQDAAPGIDAADTSVSAADTSNGADTATGAADTSTGAADTSTDPADTSTGAADASTGPVDAAVDASEAGQPTGMRIVVDNTAGSTALSSYPVLVRLDTQALIQQGLLAANCSNLRIYGGSGCAAARSYFLPAHGCNVANGELWLRVPAVAAGAREVFAVTFEASGGEASDGSRVFPFFDGFDGSSLDRARWIARGGGSVSVGSGVLQSQGLMQLESVSRAVSAGQAIAGGRFAMRGAYDTDVELGAGVVGADDPIWAPGRVWDGITFVSHDFATYAFDGPAGTRCDDLANGSLTPQIGAAWLDRPPQSASFLTAEFGYAIRSGTAEGWLRTSRGASLTYTAPSGCGLPTALPVLITLDHNTPESPVQRIDYVYVRPAAAREPSVSVLGASSQACGAAP